MATAYSKMSLKRKIAYGVLTLIVLLIIIIAMNMTFLKGQAKVATAYGAHVACSCRYIEGRDMESCAAGKIDGLEMVSLTDDTENKRVTGSVAFLAEAVAEYRDNYGCINLNEEEIDAL